MAFEKEAEVKEHFPEGCFMAYEQNGRLTFGARIYLKGDKAEPPCGNCAYITCKDNPAAKENRE